VSNISVAFIPAPKSNKDASQVLDLIGKHLVLGHQMLVCIPTGQGAYVAFNGIVDEPTGGAK
jgi:hypothetical protein